MIILVAVVLVALLGMAGLTIDMGQLLLVNKTLQATTDDAALAGAITLPASTATTVASRYSAVSGNNNARSLLNGATMVSGFPLARCISSLQSQGYACNSPENANAVQVKQQIKVAPLFMSLLGARSVTLTASTIARTGLIDLSTGVATYTVTTTTGSQYNGTAVSSGNANLPGWKTPSSNGYTDADSAWVYPPGGSGGAGATFPFGSFTYKGAAFTGVTAVNQGLFNSDDTASVSLYDITSGGVQVGQSYASTANCILGTGGTGSYCNAPAAFSYSGLSASHTYQLVAVVINTGGPSGLLIQAKGYGPAALCRDQ